MIKIRDYKGYAIHYESGKDSGFKAYQEKEMVVEAQTEQQLIDKIDRLTKQSFNSMSAYDRSFQHGRITSYNPEGRDPAFWFSTDDKERGKHTIYGDTTDFIKDTPGNKPIIDEILGLIKQADDLSKLIKEKKKSLAYITKEDLDKAITSKDD